MRYQLFILTILIIQLSLLSSCVNKYDKYTNVDGAISAVKENQDYSCPPVMIMMDITSEEFLKYIHLETARYYTEINNYYSKEGKKLQCSKMWEMREKMHKCMQTGLRDLERATDYCIKWREDMEGDSEISRCNKREENTKQTMQMILEENLRMFDANYADKCEEF